MSPFLRGHDRSAPPSRLKNLKDFIQSCNETPPINDQRQFNDAVEAQSKNLVAQALSKYRKLELRYSGNAAIDHNLSMIGKRRNE